MYQQNNNLIINSAISPLLSEIVFYYIRLAKVKSFWESVTMAAGEKGLKEAVLWEPGGRLRRSAVSFATGDAL